MYTGPTEGERATWPAPNYINPDTRVPMVLGVEITCLTLVVLFTALRFYTRIFIVKGLGLDDFIMLFASCASVGTSLMMCISTRPKYQTGYHMWDLLPSLAFDAAAKIGMAAQLLFVTISVFMKTSVLLTYLRIFPSKTNKTFCYSMFAYVVFWGIGSTSLSLFQCDPIQAYWLPFEYPNAKCIPMRLVFHIPGTSNILSDFLIFLWPAKDLWKLHLPLKQRINLVITFSLGAIVCVAGVCRLWYATIYVASSDVLWNGAYFYVIATIETSVGIICGCIPSCKALLISAA
ncbi:hypothetical protein CC80DRAFT_476214 [Byssothecium circinans]|uniref:Rhodopsin domain-containing protein n=1 Tax=Byssothecium circinans TaxID=147558 RepID=A0A6A5TQD8_9PLEO|nr:hypothetical protein CC80DRAFT_476214 [Byssothecium circinans]